MRQTTIKLSPRSRAALTTEDIARLTNFLEKDPTAFATITRNTGVHRQTIKTALENGYMELRPYIKLRDFFKELEKITA